MSVLKKDSSKSEKNERKTFKISQVDEEELKEIFDILKKDKETCALEDLNVALVFLEQQFNYKIEERVKQDIKEMESNVVEPELTFDQFKNLISQYEDEAVNQEIFQLAEILEDENLKKSIV